jgi:hypothetical protein
VTKPVVDFPTAELTGELQIRDLTEGTGAVAQAGQQAVVHYVGVAHSTGEEFDASYNRGTPFTFPLGEGRVIAGWDQGVQGCGSAAGASWSSRHTWATATGGQAGSSRAARRWCSWWTCSNCAERRAVGGTRAAAYPGRCQSSHRP